VDPRDFGRNVSRTMFAIASVRWGPHWELTEKEVAMLGDALAPLCARALEQVSGVWAEIGIVAIVLVPIVQPRLRRDRELAKRTAAEEVPA
jgi:hypothetical protein